MKPNFDKCEKTATRLLTKQEIKSLKIDVRELSFDYNIIFDSIQNYSSIVGIPLSEFMIDGILKDGCTIKISNGINLILYNEENECFPERLNWTLAHEIGHIYLGHTSDGEIEEVEAHYFVANLLMPEIVIRDMVERYDYVDGDDLYLLFNVSSTAAYKRVNTLNKKYKHFCDEEELAVLSKCVPYVDNYCHFMHRELKCAAI